MTTVTAEQITDALNQAFVTVVPNEVTRKWVKPKAVDKYARYAEAGLTRRETASRLSVTADAVGWMARKYGLKFKPGKRVYGPKKAITPKRAVEKYTGLSLMKALAAKESAALRRATR